MTPTTFSNRMFFKMNDAKCKEFRELRRFKRTVAEQSIAKAKEEARRKRTISQADVEDKNDDINDDENDE